MPLDAHLPRYDFNEVHSTAVAAAPPRALAAVRELRAHDVPLMVGLVALRQLPDRVLALVGRGARRGAAVSGAPVIDQMLRGGFFVLAESPDELVLGVVGRFWELGGGVRRIGAEEFEGFAEPGYAKAAIDFRAEPADGGALLSTETRILATDEGARRSFGRYWRVVAPGSAAIRRSWLRAIRRRAERG